MFFFCYIYSEKAEGEEGLILNYNFVIQLEDGSVMRMRDDGKILFIGSNDREFLEKNSDNLEYFRQIFGTEDNHKQGVYSCDLKNRK